MQTFLTRMDNETMITDVGSITQWILDTQAPVPASMEIRTSSNDMLAFLASVMDHHHEEENKSDPMELLAQSKQTPLVLLVLPSVQ